MRFGLFEIGDDDRETIAAAMRGEFYLPSTHLVG
jgi:hypothetical protein